MRNITATVILSFGSALVFSSAAHGLPVFEPKAGATFHKTPAGVQIPVQYGILLVPIEGQNYQNGVKGWCKWRLVNPRGASVNPSTAWLKCSLTGRSAGQI